MELQELEKLEYKPIEARNMERLTPFYGLRPNKTCDSAFLDSLIWQAYHHVEYAIAEDRAILWRMERDGEEYSAMPVCREEDLNRYFTMTEEYFNKVLKKPLEIPLADEEAVRFLNPDPSRYEITEMEDLKDYLYDGDAMRALSGKKLRKKKNHINAFLRDYEGRHEYRALSCENRYDVWNFLSRWRDQKGDEVDHHLDYEIQGIHEILKNCGHVNAKMGGVYIDNTMEAFTIGSYNALEDMAIIHIEKANPEIRGLYPFINQQFLVHAFPDAKLVNREDDMGLEGLRKAKISYEPIGYARKYKLIQRGYR